MAKANTGPVKNPFNGRRYGSDDSCIAAMERENGDQLDRLGVSAGQALFNVKNRYQIGQKTGKSVLSGRPTEWNEAARRYERFADEAERERYRQSFLERMRRVHGKDHLLGDPEQQKKMLASRSISGKYRFKDGSERTYTGKEELSLLEFLDEMQWPGSDVHCPAPQVIHYREPGTGKERFYIPDVWLESLNLIIEVKGEMHLGYRVRDIDIERAKDEVLGTSGYQYVKVESGNYLELLETIAQLKGGDDSAGA